MYNYSFTKASQLAVLANKHQVSMGEITIRQAMGEQNLSRDKVIYGMNKRLGIIRESIQKGFKISSRSKSGLSGGDAQKMAVYQDEQGLLSPVQIKAASYALSIMETNALFGRIVALPTAGSAGVVPAVLLAVAEQLKSTDEQIIEALFCAAGIGIVAGENSMLAGATGGCQAEVGNAAAMAAVSVTQLRGGDPGQALDAGAICLKSMLGLVCDPIAGLVECPCVKRNVISSANALMASELAMAGIKSNVPLDEVILALHEIGTKLSPKYRETARGGLATTQTGEEVRNNMYAKEKYCSTL